MCMQQWCWIWSMKIDVLKSGDYCVTLHLPTVTIEESRSIETQAPSRQAVDSRSLWPHIPAYQLIQCKNVTKTSTFSPVLGVDLEVLPSEPLILATHNSYICPSTRWSSESPVHIMLDSWNFRLELSPGYDTSSVTFQRQHVVWQDLCKETCFLPARQTNWHWANSLPAMLFCKSFPRKSG